MEYDETLFKDVRQQAFDLWERETNRVCSLDNDDMTGSIECKWQDRARDQLGYEHISMFCSLGEWANNITDILKDFSCDYYNFLNETHCQALFRYYTRFLLVISEMLTDFEEIIKKSKAVKQRQARKFIANSNKTQVK
jgi:hypothetical protein